MDTTTPLPFWMRVPDGPGPRYLHVNATATFGGVAELLGRVVDAQAARGTTAGWAVISGPGEFFGLAKQLHYLLHGAGDPATLRDPEQDRIYRSTLEPQGAWLAAELSPGDTVVLHDAQVLGLARAAKATGARVLWHLHIGTETPDDANVAEVWRFFADDLRHVDAILTTRPEFAPPPGFPPAERHVIAPAIDPDAPKNRDLSDAAVDALLRGIGLTGSPEPDGGGVVDQYQTLPPSALAVVQVSRFDPLKDMSGVLRAFARVPGEAHLILAGPDPNEILDDPEGLEILNAVRAVRDALPQPVRDRIHLALLSLKDLERNHLLVNALQRRADIVVQKSLEEGFGLTLTEAMYKRKPVLASDTGGLRTQVDHGVTGMLVPPADEAAAADALATLLADPALRKELGGRAEATVADRYLLSRLVDDYERLAAATAPV